MLNILLEVVSHATGVKFVTNGVLSSNWSQNDPGSVKLSIRIVGNPTACETVEENESSLGDSSQTLDPRTCVLLAYA